MCRSWRDVELGQIRGRDRALRMRDGRHPIVGHGLGSMHLKAKKLLTQRTGKDDTRVRHIELTDAGIAALSRATTAMGDLQRQLWPPSPETDAMLRAMQATAQRWKIARA
jgi:hypothetical protein